jgi:FkbM family methyltransferase
MARGVRRLLPDRWQPAARFYYERARGLIERELPLAVSRVSAGQTVADVGANVGIYTYAFARTGADVVAFEPQARWASILGHYAKAAGNVRVHRVALGAGAGEARLHVPVSEGASRPGCASLRAVKGPSTVEVVRMATLDSFQLDRVGLIKIDVEGAELGVLEGAIDTLRRNRPLLLVEIEQRHFATPIAEVFARFEELDYAGYFLDDRLCVIGIDHFDLVRHQLAPLENSANGPYVNNFLFQHRAAGAQWVN